MFGISFLFAGRIIWSMAAAAIAAIWITMKIIRIMNQRPQQNEKITQGLDGLLLLAGLVILLGCLGYFMPLHSSVCRHNLLPGSSWLTTLTTAGQSAEQLHAITDCYIRSISAMLSGLFLALCFALIWFVLRHRAYNW